MTSAAVPTLGAGDLNTEIQPREITFYLVTVEQLNAIKTKSLFVDLFMLLTSLLFGAFVSTVIGLASRVALRPDVVALLETYETVFLVSGILFDRSRFACTCGAGAIFARSRRAGLFESAAVKPNTGVQRMSLRATADAESFGSITRSSAFVIVALICLVGATGSRGPGFIALIETNSAGHQVRELAFDLTDESTTTCLGGKWKTARAVKDPGHYTRNPAYTFREGELEILLTNGPCDSYDSYIGKVSGKAFSGDHVAYGLGFHKTLGRVTGAYSK